VTSSEHSDRVEDSPHVRDVPLMISLSEPLDSLFCLVDLSLMVIVPAVNSGCQSLSFFVLDHSGHRVVASEVLICLDLLSLGAGPTLFFGVWLS
jgi:hypothetical protein